MPSRRTPLAPRTRSADAGFSVIEVIIAMSVLALMSIALVPLLLTAVQSSATNRSLVAATSYANGQLAALRQQLAASPTRSCPEIAADAAALSTTKDGLRATVTVTDCPGAASRPGTVLVTVSVAAAADPGKPLTILASQLLVRAE